MEQCSDTDLVRSARRGDRLGYAQLAGRHYEAVFLVCLGVLGRVHDAEDVAQDTMIAGFERLGQLREAEQFRNWLLTIARNLSVNLLRRNAVGRRALDRKPQEQTRQQDHNEDLREAVAQLPWDLRLPLVMYYFDGRSVKSVAQTLEMSTSGVYLKLRTATQELHEILTTQGDIR